MTLGELRQCSRARTGDAVILHVPPPLSRHRLALLLCKAPKNTTNPRGSGNAKSPAAPTALPPTATGCLALVWGATTCPQPHATASTARMCQGCSQGHEAHGMMGTTVELARGTGTKLQAGGFRTPRITRSCQKHKPNLAGISSHPPISATKAGLS